MSQHLGPTTIYPPTIPDGIAYFRLPDVQRIFGGISKSKIYDDIRRGEFTPPHKLGARTSVWSAASLRAYAEKIGM